MIIEETVRLKELTRLQMIKHEIDARQSKSRTLREPSEGLVVRFLPDDYLIFQKNYLKIK